MSARGTNHGPIGGVIPPTAREFVAAHTHWFRVVEGKRAEHWAVPDQLSAMLQLGVLQPPTPPKWGLAAPRDDQSATLNYRVGAG